MATSKKALVCLLTCAAAWPREGLKLGSVEDNLSVNGGCALQLPSQFARKEGNYVFVSNQNSALMNINGADVHLRLVAPEKSASESDAKVSGRSTLRYSGDGVEVRLDYAMTEGCPAGNGSCPVTRYDATLSIKRGKASKTVAAKAVCAK